MTALGQPQRFRAVGTRLFEAAVLQSQEEGFRGRLGLHSLPGSEGLLYQRVRHDAGRS